MNKADELVEWVAKVLFYLSDESEETTPWEEVCRELPATVLDKRLKAQRILSHPDIVFLDENQEMPSIYNGKGEMKTALKYKRSIQDFRRIGRF